MPHLPVFAHLLRAVAHNGASDSDAEGDAVAAKAAPKSLAAPATLKKARTRKATDGTPALSFRALTDHLALLSQDHLQKRTATGARTARIVLFTEPSPIQKKALT